MRAGRRLVPKEAVQTMRDRCAASLRCLPQRCRQINRQSKYQVRYSRQLERMLEKVRRRVSRSALK